MWIICRMSQLLCHPEAERIVITCMTCRKLVWLDVTPDLRRMEKLDFERRLHCSSCGDRWPWVSVEPPAGPGWGKG